MHGLTRPASRAQLGWPHGSWRASCGSSGNQPDLDDLPAELGSTAQPRDPCRSDREPTGAARFRRPSGSWTATWRSLQLSGNPGLTGCHPGSTCVRAVPNNDSWPCTCELPDWSPSTTSHDRPARTCTAVAMIRRPTFRTAERLHDLSVAAKSALRRRTVTLITWDPADPDSPDWDGGHYRQRCRPACRDAGSVGPKP